MSKKKLFAGLSLRDPETGALPEIEPPDFEVSTGLAADLRKAAETGIPAPKRGALASPTAKPSFRAHSRNLAHGEDDAKTTKKREKSAFRGLPYGTGDGMRSVGPLTRSQGAENLGIPPEHVQERKPAPRMGRDGMPRIRRDHGTPMRDGRTSASSEIERVNKTGTRKRRASSKARPRSADKTIFSGRVGMTAGKRMTPEIRAAVELRAATETLVTVAARDRAARETAENARAVAKSALRDAIGRERDAIARNDQDAVKAARADIRKFRKATTYRGV